MMPVQRVLITGITGYIGRALKKTLSANGYEVWGISKQESGDKQIVQGDLLHYDSTCQAIALVPAFSIVIHVAALAHAEKKGRNDSYTHINKTITNNVIRAVEEKRPYFIFLSSVAVYGEDLRRTPISIADELRPSSEYGSSKVLSEKLLQHSEIPNYRILRLGPVFDEFHQKDIKKRVYFPGQSRFKLVIRPSPQYSFCHLDTVLKTTLELLDRSDSGRVILNVVDSQPYDQNKLQEHFEGIELLCPVKFILPIYYLLFLFPSRLSYRLRCAFWKIFRCNLYT